LDVDRQFAARVLNVDELQQVIVASDRDVELVASFEGDLEWAVNLDRREVLGVNAASSRYSRAGQAGQAATPRGNNRDGRKEQTINRFMVQLCCIRADRRVALIRKAMRYAESLASSAYCGSFSLIWYVLSTFRAMSAVPW
jgi:hypothetical protein